MSGHRRQRSTDEGAAEVMKGGDDVAQSKNKEINKNICGPFTYLSDRKHSVRIPAPRSRGCSLHRSKSHQTAPLNSAPRSPTISSRSGEIAPRSLKFKVPLHPNTCRFQPKPYAWDTLSAWRTWSGFVAWLLRKKSASLLFCRGAAVAVWLDRTWYARIPQAVWLL